MVRVSKLGWSRLTGTLRSYFLFKDESSTEASVKKVDIADVPFYEGGEIVHIAGHDCRRESNEGQMRERELSGVS